MLRSPRRLAITSSSFCCAVNFRYLRVSPNVVSSSLSGRSSDASRTEPRRLRRLASPSRRSITSRQHEAGEQGTTGRVYGRVLGGFAVKLRCEDSGRVVVLLSSSGGL